jgi:hypothetical protein
MFGFKYIKFDSNNYVIHYSSGRIKREGKGLSFFYFSPNSSIVSIPVGSSDVQFIFQESTQDYQGITIQGQIIYTIRDPKQLAALLDFTIEKNGRYKNDDFEKLKQRLINETQASVTAYAQTLDLKKALVSVAEFEEKINQGLANSRIVGMLGVEILSVNVLEIKPTPEMAKALEATTREALQQESDQAIYERRNFAVEQERRIKESELNTEIAVEEKKKQIVEKKMETEVSKEESKKKIRKMQMDADIELEQSRVELVKLQTENEKQEADSKKYVLESTLSPYQNMDWKTLLAISGKGGDPGLNVALAFRELSENAEKIGNLNITPELLDSLVQQRRV